MRKLRFTLFMLCMFVCSITQAYDFSAVNSDGVTIYYNIIKGGCEVTSGDNGYSGKVNIPSEVVWNSESYSVTSIGREAFKYCFELTSVSIPNSATSIGYDAFEGCSSLTSVAIPNSVEYIGISAFMGCSNLTSVAIPNSVEYIGISAFARCSSLSSITVEKDNHEYDSRDECNAIIDKSTNILIAGCKNTVVPSSVTKIAAHAFEGCSGITSISIPPTVTEIGVSALAGCSKLTSIAIPNSVTSIGDYAFNGCSGLTSITIPNSVTSIATGMCFGCSNLTSITIPSSVLSIGEGAFSNCSALTSIIIPNSVTNIEILAFAFCYKLESIVVAKDNVIYDSRDNCNAIIEKSTNTLIAGCYNTIIPNSVTSIEECAFWSGSRLTSIIIPNSVTGIGSWAFHTCNGLTDIYNYALTPQIITNDVFSTYQTLHVRKGCKTAYENAEYWNQFTIVEDLLLDEPVTDINSYDNIIFFNPTTARPGKQVVMPLMMNNKDKITAMQFNVVLPEGVSLDKNSKGKYALKFNENAERADASSHTLSSNLQDDGSILVLCYSVDNTIFSGNNGAVIDFPITLAENIEPGGYPITLKNVVMTKSNKEEINIGEIVCLLEVPDYKQGDANNDNIINVTDIVYTADHILGNSDANFNPKAVDMNEDNIINVTDIVYIADMILSGNANNAKAMPAKSTSRAAGESTLNIVPFNIAPGGNKTVTLDMDNPGREITAFQFDMYLPEGLTIDKKANGKFKLTFNSDTERTDASCHTLAASQQDDGAITFLCYSVDKDAFTGEQGAIVDIPFTASASMPAGVFDISLRNILLTCTDKSEIKPADCIVKVTVGNSTAISELSERNTADAYYNINGMRQSAMNNGINIVRMSNGTVKKIVK